MLSLILALMPLFGPQAASAPTAPAWTFKESTDPAQPKSASATIRSEDGNARLVVRCDTAAAPIVSVQFIPRPPIPAGESRTVTVTYDEAMAEMSQWQFPGAGAYNGEAVEVFLLVDKIAKSKTVRVGVPQGETMIEGVFKAPGDDALFRKVYAACGFPYAMPVPTAPKK
ncbi:hypothetical protein [uncultured Sphingomonas sp.]|uniref:hypothetical protein n=1 Tax=uncultured Sphingomonas sp. TaxID=158754 RepID=UPI0025D5D519|nr:hypothetical protein [uncultured Sphingomonas sp.]